MRIEISGIELRKPLNIIGFFLNLVPNDKFSDLSYLNAFADVKVNVNKKNEFCFWKDGKQCGKSRKCCLPIHVFSPFSTMFLKAFYFTVVESPG